jgi:hypothetical protein
MSGTLGSLRDAVAKRQYQAGVNNVASWSAKVGLDAAVAAFIPERNTIYLVVPTAARAYTITEAGMATQDLAVGEGYRFVIQNNSAGANTITVTAGGGANVASGAGTFTIAQANTREFFIRRTSATTHELTTFGTAAH